MTVTCREISYTDTIAEYELTCTDTGIGMSEEFQKRAFEPFAQEGQSARQNMQVLVWDLPLPEN